MVKLLGHRQTKETATDKLHLLLPRHIPTLPIVWVRNETRKPPFARTASHFQTQLSAKVGNRCCRPPSAI